MGSVKPLQHHLNAARRRKTFADTGWVALWGGVAVLFGLVGMSSVFLTDDTSSGMTATLLPPAGDVSTTASIAADGALEIFPSAGGVEAVQERRQIKGEVDVLRREIAALKRTVAVLQERREAAVLAPDEAAVSNVAPVSSAKANFGARVDAAVEAVAGKPEPVETLPAPSATSEMSSVESAPGAASSARAAASAGIPDPEQALPENLREPVRIVALPGTRVPETVASIPRASEPGVPDGTERDGPETSILVVSPAAGRISGEGSRRVGRSDFGLDLGLHDTREDAMAAWSGLREEHAGLPEGIGATAVDDTESARVRLYAGPFANAADAAATCVYLAVRDITCTPSLYPQETMATRSP